MISEKELTRMSAIARSTRRNVLDVIVAAHASHIGSAYSAVELLVYLYEKVLRINPARPNAESRDRFILSKGWGVSALYSILSDKHILDGSFKKQYCADGSQYIGIATRNGLAGLEATTGSMGHGLPVGVGIALAARLKRLKYRVFVLISDGELDEGSTWEAVLQAGHLKLDNLTVIIDQNGWQSFGRTRDILDTAPVGPKFESFGWSVRACDGHNFRQIDRAFARIPIARGKPSVIIARTIKGKGVSVFEDSNQWHYRTPGEHETAIARRELAEPAAT